MFILHIDSNDPKQITEVLKEVAESLKITDNTLRHASNGVNFEFDTFRKQEFKTMANLLHFNPDGMTLKETGWMKCTTTP